jgi:hypothetical protein
MATTDVELGRGKTAISFLGILIVLELATVRE